MSTEKPLSQQHLDALVIAGHGGASPLARLELLEGYINALNAEKKLETKTSVSITSSPLYPLKDLPDGTSPFYDSYVMPTGCKFSVTGVTETKQEEKMQKEEPNEQEEKPSYSNEELNLLMKVFDEKPKEPGTGKKYDDGKVPLDLLSSVALEEIAKVMAFGKKKYAAHNWRGGLAWSRVIGAALRHVMAFNRGEDKDPETGLSHLAHAGCCILFLLEYEKTHRELDDRYKEIKL